MATEKTTQILDAIKELTIIELADLVKAVEEEFGVSAAAPVAVAAAPVAGGEAAAAEEKTHGAGRYHQGGGAGSAGSDPLLEEGPADPDLESGTHGKRAV